MRKAVPLALALLVPLSAVPSFAAAPPAADVRLIEIGAPWRPELGVPPLGVVLGVLRGDVSPKKAQKAVRTGDFSSIDNAPEEKERGITINTSHVEYATCS